MGLLTQTQQQYYDSGIYGGYQFISLANVIDNFMATYIGEGKILTDTKRSDVSFHAHRALAELSFDTFKSTKSQEIEVAPSLTMPLPQDYVNYVKLTRSDSSGIEHVLYPTSKTSNPVPILQNSDGDYALTAEATTNGANNLVTLDDEYPDVLPGMTVDVPYNGTVTQFPPGSLIVWRVYNQGGVTLITIFDSVANAIWVPGVAFSTTLTFTNTSGDLVLQKESSHIVEGLSWNNTLPIMTATTAASIADIRVGMEVGNRAFGIGTTVTSINGLVITVSAVAAVVSGVGEDVTFTSFNSISDTWKKYNSLTSSAGQDYDSDYYISNMGQRFGIDPQHAQSNGSFYIDDLKGLIHFGSGLSGQTIILHYISDSLGTDPEMQVHKFAEEAIYKHIIYACVSAKLNVPEYIVNRFKRERFAETRKAKLRLSNIKIEEITQIFRGKSKLIKH